MTGSGELPATEVVELQVGERTLEIEQVAEIEALVNKSVRTKDEPFWARLWPSARVLVATVAELGDLSGRRVLDLGCGPGAAGLAASMLGAEVVLADYRPEAVALATRNIRRNHLDAEAKVLDWNDPPADLGQFDGILAADVLYGDGMLRGVLRFIRGHLAPDGQALLADPNRVQPGGVEGAARLSGMQAETLLVRPGRSLVGGVTLYRLQPRSRPGFRSP